MAGDDDNDDDWWMQADDARQEPCPTPEPAPYLSLPAGTVSVHIEAADQETSLAAPQQQEQATSTSTASSLHTTVTSDNDVQLLFEPPAISFQREATSSAAVLRLMSGADDVKASGASSRLGELSGNMAAAMSGIKCRTARRHRGSSLPPMILMAHSS